MPPESFSLTDMQSTASIVYTEKQSVLALIAALEPDVIERAIEATATKRYNYDNAARDDLIVDAEHTYNWTVQVGSPESKRDSAREKLEQAIAKKADAISKREALKPELVLAKQLKREQNRLSRMTRLSAAVGLTIVLGGGLGMVGHVLDEHEQQPAETAQQSDAYPSEKNTTTEAFGGIGVLLGMTSYMGLGYTGQIAQRKARKILARTS
jgi:hypothetical protein